MSLPCFAQTLNCKEQNKILITMPPPRDQGPTGDCYAFAARALLQNLYCHDHDCHFGGGNDDTLSVLDAIALTQHKRIKSGGQTPDVLNAVKREGKLFHESCAPFDVILKNSERVNDGKEVKWHYLIRQAMADAYKPSGDLKTIAQRLISTLGLKTDVSVVADSITKKDISIVSYDLFIPKSCEDERVALKNFEVKNFNGDDVESIRNQVRQLLRRGIVVETDVCVSALPTQGPDSLEKCGAHSSVINGIHELCCGSKCTTEYQFYDSAAQFPANEWVSEKVYFDKLHRMSQVLTGQTRTDLNWIE